MKITVFGAGYVGLVTGICFAELGNNVICMDVDQQKIKNLQQGKLPIYEPDLVEMLQRNLQAKRITFTTDPITAVNHGLFQFIAVGTPSDEDGAADLRYVLAVAENIGKYMNDYRIVVNKSTVPIGSAEIVRAKIVSELSQRQLNIHHDIVSNPEFLKEGNAVNDFMQPDRIIIGAESAAAIEKMRQLYLPLVDSTERFVVMDIPSAELTKYAANAFLATKISFMNEISQLAERVGADIERVRVGIGTDPRIGSKFLFAGCGYGGSCFPKDVKALRKIAEQYHVEHEILNAVEEVNARQKKILLKKMQQHFNDQLNNKIIAVWGLAFKPNTDDMREASSRVLLENLWEQGAKVKAYDPVAQEEAKRIYGKRNDLEFCGTAEEALEGADALAIVTEWQEFRSFDFQLMKQKLRQPIIFDGRNLYNPTELAAQGFTYYSIGRERK